MHFELCKVKKKHIKVGISKLNEKKKIKLKINSFIHSTPNKRTNETWELYVLQAQICIRSDYHIGSHRITLLIKYALEYFLKLQ